MSHRRRKSKATPWRLTTRKIRGESRLVEVRRLADGRERVRVLKSNDMRRSWADPNKYPRTYRRIKGKGEIGTIYELQQFGKATGRYFKKELDSNRKAVMQAIPEEDAIPDTEWAKNLTRDSKLLVFDSTHKTKIEAERRTKELEEGGVKNVRVLTSKITKEARLLTPIGYSKGKFAVYSSG